jgi:hypothetical protein
MNRAASALIFASLLAGLSGGIAMAQEAADKLSDIRTQQQELKGQLEAGELSHLTKRQQNAIGRAQSDVFAIIEGRQTLDELNIAEKVRLENALERINANFVGTNAAGRDQLVCKRVALSGTGMKTTRCAPQAEWDQVRETSRGSLEKRWVCTPPGCGT